MTWLLLWLIGSFVFLLGYVSGALLSRAGADGEVEASEQDTRAVVALVSRRKA